MLEWSGVSFLSTWCWLVLGRGLRGKTDEERENIRGKPKKARETREEESKQTHRLDMKYGDRNVVICGHSLNW